MAEGNSEIRMTNAEVSLQNAKSCIRVIREIRGQEIFGEW